MRQLLTAPQVAAALGYKLAWFQRNRARLEAQHGFPPPVDGCGMRWDPAAIEDWLDARRRTTREAARMSAEDLLIARARAMQAELTPMGQMLAEDLLIARARAMQAELAAEAQPTGRRT